MEPVDVSLPDDLALYTGIALEPLVAEIGTPPDSMFEHLLSSDDDSGSDDDSEGDGSVGPGHSDGD